MNIGLFTDTYPPQINGVATSVFMLQKELTQRGHRVYVFTTSDPHADTTPLNVIRLPSIPFAFLPSHRVAIMYSPKLLRRIKSLQLDIVHSHTEFPLGFLGSLVAKMYGIPRVHTYHTMYEDYVHYIFNGKLLSPNAAKRFSRMFCNRAHLMIAPTAKTRNYLQEIGVTRPIETIPTGIDFSTMAPGNYSAETLAATRAQYGIAPSDPVVVSIGRVAREKSLDVLVAAMPKVLAVLPNAKLLIVGGGPVQADLAQQAAALGITDAVLFAGPQPWETIGKFYQLGNLFATASTSETQGLTYIEAMAAQVPVAVKNDPCFVERIVHGQTGFVFDGQHDVAEVLLHALTSPEAVKRVVANGLEVIEPLSARAYAGSVERAYCSLL